MGPSSEWLLLDEALVSLERWYGCWFDGCVKIARACSRSSVPGLGHRDATIVIGIHTHLGHAIGVARRAANTLESRRVPTPQVYGPLWSDPCGRTPVVGPLRSPMTPEPPNPSTANCNPPPRERCVILSRRVDGTTLLAPMCMRVKYMCERAMIPPSLRRRWLALAVLLSLVPKVPPLPIRPPCSMHARWRLITKQGKHGGGGSSAAGPCPGNFIRSGPIRSHAPPVLLRFVLLGAVALTQVCPARRDLLRRFYSAGHDRGSLPLRSQVRIRVARLPLT